jgi:ubiquitin-activating enzyme E1
MFNSSVYLPHITGPYIGGSDDDPAAAVPICTIKEFPTNAQQCLMFAKSEFIMEFSDVPSFTTSVLRSKEKPAHSDSFLILQRISESMVNMSSFEQCIAWAHSFYFESVFRIQTLTLVHPQDEMTKTGKFWAPPRRFPTTADFDGSDPLLRSFVLSAAVLKAKTCGIAVPDDLSTFSFPLEQDSKPESHRICSNYVEERKLKLAKKPLEDALLEDDDEDTRGKVAMEDAKHAAFKEEESSKIMSALSRISDAPPSKFQSMDFNKDDASHMYAVESISI